VLIDWNHVQATTVGLPESPVISQYKITYAAPGLILPLVIGGAIAVFSNRNGGKRFVLAVFWVSAALIMLRLPTLGMPARKALMLEPVTHTPGAYLLKNDSPPFTIEIPEGFKAYDSAKKSPDVTHVFVSDPTGENGGRLVVGIKTRGSMLSSDHEMNRKGLKETMPPDGELTTKNWRGIPVYTCITHGEKDGIPVVTYQVLVPLKPKAIELAVFGMASKSSAISALVDKLLASLDGQTNWRRLSGDN
jgi:hypothetical protein